MRRRGLIASFSALVVVALVLIMWLRFLLNPKIDQVIVMDLLHAGNPIIRTINLAEELKAFRAIWSKREKLPSGTVVHVQYKFSILSGDHGESWLYDSAGLTLLLSKTSNVRYRLPSAEVFNQLLGIDQPRTPE